MGGDSVESSIGCSLPPNQTPLKTFYTSLRSANLKRAEDQIKSAKQIYAARRRIKRFKDLNAFPAADVCLKSFDLRFDVSRCILLTIRLLMQNPSYF